MIESSRKVSWIRRYFGRQDDFTLWCIGFVWFVAQLTLALLILTLVATALAGLL